MPKAEWDEQALDDLEKIDSPIVKRILHKISWFSKYFGAVTPEALCADMAGLFKLKVGDWRVIYEIGKDVIVIKAVGQRREIYKL